ncbi:MAG: hypothetical protein J1F20_00270 [Muribaculaceae bacterium]|nr:hypothetical protein [Muribaculaceae bacterium]
MKRFALYTLIIFSLFVCMGAIAFAGMGDPDDDNTRLNPEIESTNVDRNFFNDYPYIAYDDNHIDMNGNDWSKLSIKLNSALSDSVFTILHIGDSHIQADILSGTLRKLLQERYGNAGRGIIVPFKLAGTNEPLDYSITSRSDFLKSILMKQPWKIDMGFTGVSLLPLKTRCTYNIKTTLPSSKITLFADGHPEIEKITVDDKLIAYETSYTALGLEIRTATPFDNIALTLNQKTPLYGFNLISDETGVVYHAVGNNGATFASYNQIESLHRGMKAISPDLVIISLGTNEAFGRYDAVELEKSIGTFVNTVRQSIPTAKILMTTPAESQKSRRVKRKKGKSRHVRTYSVNTNVALVRNVIVDYGRKNSIPVYDFYGIAGGEGASDKWLKDKLLSKDRIHFTFDGYRLQGQLLFEALIKIMSLDTPKYENNVCL